VWKQTFVILGGLTLAVSLPIVALGMTTDRTPALNATPATITDWGQTVEATPTMVQQQLRVHAETGPPEGFEPIRQQLHRNEAQAAGSQDSPGRNQWADDAQRQGHGAVGQQGPHGNGQQGPHGHGAGTDG